MSVRSLLLHRLASNTNLWRHKRKFVPALDASIPSPSISNVKPRKHFSVSRFFRQIHLSTSEQSFGIHKVLIHERPDLMMTVITEQWVMSLVDTNSTIYLPEWDLRPQQHLLQWPAPLHSRTTLSPLELSEPESEGAACVVRRQRPWSAGRAQLHQCPQYKTS